MPKNKKRLRAQITVGHDADNKPIYKWASGYTKKELAENKEELRRIYINGAVAIRRDMLLGEFVTEWFNTYKLGAASKSGKMISASTQANYRTAINIHIFPAFAQRQIRAITAADLQAFMNGMSEYGKTLINDAYSVLRNCFSMAYAQGIIDRDPAAALKKPQAAAAEERRALTDAETQAVLTLINTHPDGLFLALLYYTGMRRGEALGLQWRDVDFKKRTIHVERDVDPHTASIGDVKTPHSIRFVPIPNELNDILKRRQGIGNAYIIESRGTFWHITTFMLHWKKIQIALHQLAPGIESRIVDTIKPKNPEGEIIPVIGSILTPHYFRHNYASILYNNGVDVMSAQRFLGHSDPRTTMAIYTHLADKTVENDALKVQSAFSAGKNLARNV